MNKYKRDSRSPIPKSETVSKVMSANKSRGTGPEKSLKSALLGSGIGDFKMNYRDAPGRPDIAFPRYKVVVFINGCFWHRCPYCNLPMPKTNIEYWTSKFDANVKRDQLKTQALIDMGWKVVLCWECEIKTDSADCVDRIRKALADSAIARS